MKWRNLSRMCKVLYTDWIINLNNFHIFAQNLSILHLLQTHQMELYVVYWSFLNYFFRHTNCTFVYFQNKPTFGTAKGPVIMADSRLNQLNIHAILDFYNIMWWGEQVLRVSDTLARIYLFWKNKYTGFRSTKIVFISNV